MSFLVDLRAALAANGIRGALANRIVDELADHLACGPDANVGSPDEIAQRFAVELRIGRTRRATVGTFAALALCAGLMTVVAATPPNRSTAVGALGGLGIFAFSQIAFVAGMLALVRGLRGRTPGDLRLAQRRALVALAAGLGVCGCIAVQQIWLAVLPVPAVMLAARALRRARTLTPSGPAAGLSADLPVPLAVFGAVAVALVIAQGVVGERSLVEGLFRGAIEAAGLAAGVLLLGRPLGLRN